RLVQEGHRQQRPQPAEQERVAGGAGDAVQRDYGAFTIAPAFITKVTRSSSVMSLSGPPETATRSACLPGAISPRSDFGHAFAPGLHSGSSSAPATEVSERITAIGGIPASAISLASAAGFMLHGNAPASVPNAIRTPRLNA